MLSPSRSHSLGGIGCPICYFVILPILASALNYTSIQIINGTENDFSRAVLDSKLFKRTDGASLWPGKEMSAEELDMTDPTGIDPLDFIAKAAMENPKKYKKARD